MKLPPMKTLMVFFLLALAAGCEPKLSKDAEFLFGTLVEVTSPDPRAKDIVFSEFRRLEPVVNLFDETSELSRLNKSGELKVSADLFEILNKAKFFYEETDGAFDVTIAPLSLLWKKAIQRSEFPPLQEIKDLMDLVGFDGVYLDGASRRVRLLKLGAKIDLGGIAKGYAVDKAVAKLKEAGVASAIVSAGGDLYCLGKNRNKKWRVGIRNPRRGESLIGKIELEDKAVSTSGDYEQFFIFRNKRYSHIINPKTGFPADSGIISATVIAEDSTTADALATAFFVLGKDKSANILKRFKGVQGELIDESGKSFSYKSNG